MFDDTITLELDYPITEEQMDAILDIDMEHTVSVTFHTKNGKEVEFEKRKKGKWVQSELDKDFLTCSNCKTEKLKMRMSYRRDYTNIFLYCPICGADMRGNKDAE